MNTKLIYWPETLISTTVLVVVLVAWLALDLPMGPSPDQPKRSQTAVDEINSGVQPGTYLDGALCLVEGVGHPEGCRGGLPECLQEDGSGPGIMCWYTSSTGLLWLNDGDESNDRP